MKRGRTILVVEDVRESREALVSMFDEILADISPAPNVVAVKSGKAAAERIQKEGASYDLLSLDILPAQPAAWAGVTG